MKNANTMNKDQAKSSVDMEMVISQSLRIGVMISAAVIFIGLLLFFITGKSGYAIDQYPITPGAIFSGLVAFKSYAIILTGLLLLILTPVFRVGISIVAFYMEKDYLYVVITTIVFAILITSFLLGKAG
ncbi:DUF1634 domain-containing protein [Tepidibacillus marianensis]|uniref:DUF1634 domain-containing protein n=1 Tax=Tepidibacillus marianensis TaxID=3131995 RepID=UPI0030CB446F